jgi:hypothetical protein
MRTFRFRVLLAAVPVLFVAAAATGCSAEPSPGAAAPSDSSVSGAPGEGESAGPAEGDGDGAGASDGDGTAPAEGEGASQTSGKAPGTGQTSGKAPGAGQTSGKGKVSACRAGDVKGTVTAQGPLITGDEVRAIISLENVSSRVCRVEGWTTVTLVNAAGEPTPLTVGKVKQPGPAVRIDLKPGHSAPAGMKWTQCDKGDDTCPVGNTLEIGLPGATGEPATLEDFPAPEKSGIAMKNVQVGPLQLSRQGVVAW